MEQTLQQLLYDLGITMAEFGLLSALAYGLAKLSDLVLSRLRRVPAMAQPERFEAVRSGTRRFILIGFLLATVALLIFNTTLILRGQPVLQGSVELLRTSLPPGFWSRLGWGLAQLALMVVAARFVLRLLRRWLPLLERRVAGISTLGASERQVKSFFGTLQGIARNGLWGVVAGLGARAVGLPNVVAEVIFVGLRIYLIIAVGRLIVSILGTVINTLDSLSERYINSPQLDAFYTHLRGLLPLFSRTLEFIIYVGALTLAVTQVQALAGLATYGRIAIQVLGLFFLSRVAIEVVHVLIDRFFLEREPHLSDAQWQQRLTFAPLLKSASRYGVYAATLLLVLVSLGFDVGPILVGLGGVGLVLGLAAQPVTTDLISGLFILFENLFLVGDYIETGNARGTVESIDVRTTRIRDPDGQLHLVRNGQIGDIVNYSKGYVYAVVMVSVADDSDLDQVFALIEEAGRQLDQANDDMLEPTIVQGIEEFGDGTLTLRTLTRVRPGQHQQVARELRRELKRAFDRVGVATDGPRTQLAQLLLSPTRQRPMVRDAGS
jgi:small conductance mechanosensitive channel